MLAERAKSRPAMTAAGAKQPCPVARVAREDWDAITSDGHFGALERGGLELAAIITLVPPDETSAQAFSALRAVSQDTTPRRLPVYHLPTFFLDTLIPDLTSFTSSSTPCPTPSTSPSDSLILAVRTPLDSLVDLFARREGIPHEDDPSSTAAYAIYSGPLGIGGGDALPLLIALWRCRLWSGEGWQAMELTR